MHEKSEDVKCKCAEGVCPCCDACDCKTEATLPELDKETAAFVEEFGYREKGVK